MLKISLANNFYEYQNEIELVQAQNRVECDLYSIIAQIIRENVQGKNISLRDVSERRETEFSKPFRGDSGFPDFVIRTREKSNNARNLGAVEAKYVTKDLNLKKYLDQLDGHIRFYERVIYTNGLEWRFYNKNNPDKNWKVILGEIINNTFEWKDLKQWEKLLTELDNIVWTD